MKYISFLFLLASNFLFLNVDKEYVKDYDNGLLTSEGWTLNGEKHGYWKFYDQGKVSSQGHFKNNEKDGYWHFYNNSKVVREGYFENNKKESWWTFHNYKDYKTVKKQYVSDRLQGYILYYKRSILSKVEEYQFDKKLGEWTSYWKFKADHPDFSFKDLKR